MGQLSQTGEFLKQQFLNGQGVVTQLPGPAHSTTRKFYKNHQGFDIAVKPGTPINTAGMEFVGSGWDNTGYGTRATYRDPKTNRDYTFSHLSKVEKTPQGVLSYTGGRPGIDGNSTGAHLDIVLGGSGFRGLLQSAVSKARSSGQSAYKRTVSRDPRSVLEKAKSLYGKRVIGVSSSAKGLSEAQKKYGGQIVRL